MAASISWEVLFALCKHGETSGSPTGNTIITYLYDVGILTVSGLLLTTILMINSTNVNDIITYLYDVGILTMSGLRLIAMLMIVQMLMMFGGFC